MQEIADWLKKLGMSEYTQRFAKERVDFSVLAELTDQHLKDLGLPLGDRLKMLRAIHELADPIPASPQQVGDALMSLFGYPIAHDNDAERAARAALGIQRAFDELNRKNAGAERLAVRIGVDTGPAVIDAAGEIYGDVANIAARVQALADPGEVVVTARVQHQIAGLFVAESSWHAYAQRRAGANGRLPPGACERRWSTLGAASTNAPGRSRRGNCHAVAALGTGTARRRSTGPDCRRAGAR